MHATASYRERHYPVNACECQYSSDPSGALAASTGRSIWTVDAAAGAFGAEQPTETSMTHADRIHFSPVDPDMAWIKLRALSEPAQLASVELW